VSPLEAALLKTGCGIRIIQQIAGRALQFCTPFARSTQEHGSWSRASRCLSSVNSA